MRDEKKERKRCCLWEPVSLSLSHKEELSGMQAACSRWCWVEAGRSAVQTGSVKPAASASLHFN